MTPSKWPSLKWLRHSAVLVLLGCLCSAVPALARQTAAAQDDEDEPPTPALTVTATLEENGRLTLATYILGPVKDKAVEPALQAAFGCTLTESTKYRSVPGSYFGTCQVQAAPSGLLHELHFATAPLRDFALQNKLDLLSLQLTLPDTQVRETLPATPIFEASRSHLPAKARRRLEAVRVFSWRTTAAMPEFITIRFGYNSGSVQRSLTLLFLSLTVPVLLALWLRRRALTAKFEDKSSVWFSYIRYQQWLLNLALLAWWASTETVHLDALLRFLLVTTTPRAPSLIILLSILVVWLPPVGVWVACTVISQPVQENLRGWNRTRKELALQAIYSISSALVPLLLAIKGIAAIARGDFRTLVLCLAGAVVVRLIAAGRLLKLLGMEPQALTTGELRDTAFHMAHRLGVRLQQIYIIPAGRLEMANAFARTGNTIGFTDYLLQRMSRREVNYILGHELSHLRLKHLQKLSFALVLTVFACVAAQMGFRGFLPDSVFLRYSLFFFVVTAGTYFWSRRFEFQADAGAVEATGDPEGAISALFKLSALNMHPLQWSKWSEKWLTHPSSLRRAQAIARKANIAVERVAEIAQTATQQDGHYGIPASAIAANKLHSSTKKISDVRRITLALLGARMLIPAGVALAVKFVPMSASADRLAYVTGLIVTFVAYLALINVVSTSRLRSLIPVLREKLEKEGLRVEEWNAVPVGLAPAAIPRIYEGHSHWDLGYVFFSGDRLCYWGEETRFALRRDQVTDIKLGLGSPHLFRLYRVYIAWRDAEQASCGVFSLAAANPGTILGNGRRTKALLSQILRWHAQSVPCAKSDGHEYAESFSSPRFGNVTGMSPLVAGTPGKILKELYVNALLAAGVAVVFGLPFHFLDFLRDPSGFAARPHAPGSAWYVVIVATLIRLIQYLPFLRYKEMPVVQAKLPPPTQRSTPPPPKPEPEPVAR